MNFTVRWEPDIYIELTQLWAISPDPAAVRAAREKVEVALADDPFRAGRHLSEGLWPLYVPPLVVHYTIDREQLLVEITDVQATE